MAPRRPRRRRNAGIHAVAGFADWWERRWARGRLWFRRHARENVVLAIVATIGAWLSKPFKRYRARDTVIFGALAVGVLVVLAVAFLSDRGGPGTQLVRAVEPPTTAAVAMAPMAEADRAPTPQPDITPPPLLLDPSLTDGVNVGTNHIVVSGVTDPNARVVISGIELTADGDGAFAADVPLAIGPNRVEIVATDPTGNATGAALTIVYKVDAPPPPPKQTPKRVVVTTTSTVPPPPSTTRAPAATANKGTPMTGAQTTTTLASTTTTSTATLEGGVSFPTVPTTAKSSTTTPATTTQAPTTTQATTTTEATTTTQAATTTQPTTTQPPDTTAAVPTSDPSPATTT
jgi:Glucodextranase, domain B